MSVLLTAVGLMTFVVDLLLLSIPMVHVAKGRLAMAAISCMCLYIDSAIYGI